jgi:hypothetical protein
MLLVWKFGSPPNLAVIAHRKIVFAGDVIRYASHDADDGGWQFLNGELVTEADAAVVSLQDIVDLDRSIEELADLPEGWYAERDSMGSPWRRAKS